MRSYDRWQRSQRFFSLFFGSLGLCMVDSPRGEFFTTDYTDCTDFFIFSREFALFAVDFGSTMQNPKEPVFLCASVVNILFGSGLSRLGQDASINRQRLPRGAFPRELRRALQAAFPQVSP